MMKFIRKQRGAMFGLDARLALAILAGLSIIAGSALVMTSSGAEGAALQREIEATKEAVISLQYDLKTPIEDAPSAAITPQKTYQILVRRDLVAAALQPRWLGPYLVMQAWGSEYVKFGLREISVGTATVPATACASDCYLWLSIENVPVTVAEALNDIVDGADEANPDTSGEILWADNSGENLTHARLMGVMP